jgi:thymidylate synthase (FAD)
VTTDKLDEAEKIFVDSCYTASINYPKLLVWGWAPQQAREILPNALKTEIVLTANLREWRHICNLRSVGTTGTPHPEMREVMDRALFLLHQEIPVIFDDIYEVRWPK